jgi:hypothetical protein
VKSVSEKTHSNLFYNAPAATLGDVMLALIAKMENQRKKFLFFYNRKSHSNGLFCGLRISC